MKLTTEQLLNGQLPKTNDLEKGDRVLLRNGWKAIIADNARGNTRIAKVYGFEVETGSVYSHDIYAYIAPPGIDGVSLMFELDHTPAQKKLKKTVEDILG